MGIVSSIGNNVTEVTDALRHGRSGITHAPEYAALGFKSHVYGKPTLDWTQGGDRKPRRFMGQGAAWNYAAMREAIAISGLEAKEVSHERTGIIMGSGGPSVEAIVRAAHILDTDKVTKKIGPFEVPKAMASTASATLAVPFAIKGVNYSISSACATSAHCIGNAAEQILSGKQDVMFAGGHEELSPYLSCLFDAMGAMSSTFNHQPEAASRAYDKQRDGFVIAGGAGVLVLEEYDHAKARGARVLAELVGYGATSDGYDMVQPSGEGAVRCMRQALRGFCGRDWTHEVKYVNTHGTATGIGDIRETEALRAVFGSNVPPFSSTKSLTGHSLGAAGVQEAIYSIIMLREGFLTASANIDELDPAFSDLPIIRTTQSSDAYSVLSNSFGFGGTNASLFFGLHDE
jgi:3-oxoacyl-[acyl-carrier-protein] synthase-1